jgi:APA family basic amino acid/polyamine antiporter
MGLITASPLPIGVIGSLVICTLFYLLVSGGAVGAVGAQPVVDATTGMAFEPGSPGLAAACELPANEQAFACSPEPLAHVISQLGWRTASQFIGLAAFLAMPAVVLMMLFGQTRIFFAMARDRLLPFNESLSRIHPRFKTPYVVTLITGVGVTIFASLFPVGVLADISNSGTLFAFMTVALGVIILRRRPAAPPRRRRLLRLRRRRHRPRRRRPRPPRPRDPPSRRPGPRARRAGRPGPPAPPARPRARRRSSPPPSCARRRCSSAGR